MKKLIIPIGILSLMSFTSIKMYRDYKLKQALTTVQDMKEWMLQDIESGNIDPELGENYMYWLEEVEVEMIDYILDN